MFKFNTVLLASIALSQAGFSRSNVFEFKNYEKNDYGCEAKIELLTGKINHFPIPKVMISMEEEKKIWTPHSYVSVEQLEKKKYRIKISDSISDDADCNEIKNRFVVVHY